MKNKQAIVQKYGIKIFQIAIFVFAFYLMQTTANAQLEFGTQNRISSVYSGKCILALKAVNGEQIIQMNCDQDFEPFFLHNGNGDSFQIKVKSVNKCLEVKSYGTGNGTPVILSDCHGGNNQIWTAQPLGEGYQIKSAHSGKCLDVRGPSKNDGTPIQIWECGNETGKQMIFTINKRFSRTSGTKIPTVSTTGGNAPEKTVLSAYDMNLAMTWIAAQVSAQRLSFCYRQSFTRGVGEPASTCANGWEKVGLRCQPKCVAGYERSGTHCRAVCPQGFTDIGSYCQKPAPYGRGTGWAGYSAVGGKTAIQRCEEGNRSKGDGGSPAGQSCEMWGAYAYPKCKTGFHNVGANICSPDCPYNWQDTGTGCYKPATPANLSGDPLGCKPGMEGKDGLCYNKCNKADYSGVGPVCWQNCPSQMPVNCGAGCATTSKDCAMAISDMVISPIMAAVSLATLGGASGVTIAGNTIKGGATQTATKAPGIIAKMKAIYAKIDAEVKVIKLTNNAYKTSNAVISERDLVLKEFAENFAEMTSYEINKTLEERLHPKQVAEIKLEWAKRHFYLMGQTNADVTLRNALTVASVVDPSGLLAVEKAFYHPVCKNSTPFPILENYVE